jgi:glucokinase
MQIGVDFGATRIKAGRVQDGRVTAIAWRDTPADRGPQAVLDAIAEAITDLDPRPESAGVVIPGEVDDAGRCWRLPNVPGFEGVAIAAELAARLGGARVAIENDSTTAALGELLFGHGGAHASFLSVTLGTGIGGGLVIERRLRRGKNGFAGEIGHLLIDSRPDAPPCVCGKRGCLETYAGTLALFRRYAELGRQAATIRAIAEAAVAGEADALEVFAGMGRALGLGLAQIQKLLDLDAIVFSGGISASFGLIEPSLRAALIEQAFAPPLGAVPLLVSPLGEHAGLLGAAYLTENHATLPEA